jgi:hypothetical protein
MHSDDFARYATFRGFLYDVEGEEEPPLTPSHRFNEPRQERRAAPSREEEDDTCNE